MALSKTALENLIVAGMRNAMRELFPDVILNIDVETVQQVNGEVQIKVTEDRGPLVPDEKSIRAMARGIAHGIVEHLKHAEVSVDPTTHEGGIS